jgi:hypothetical protein
VVWRDDLDDDLTDLARRTLANVVQEAEKEQEPVVGQIEMMEDYVAEEPGKKSPE